MVAFFEVLIVKPIFNLLVLIYNLLPGHNLGLAIIVFTVVIRLIMWPLVKKQLHHTKAMRALQPEIKRIKQATKGDRQKESLLIMELYKERQISPFSSLGLIIVQLIIFIGLYQGLSRIVGHPEALLEHSYSWLRFGWLDTLAADIGRFDATLFGVVDLTKSAIQKSGGIYWPAMFIVISSAVAQYFQSQQLMPVDKDARKLRQILRDASSGQQADQAEVNAAIGRTTRFFIPALIFLFTVGIASALSLYWLVSGLVAYWQQARVLKQDETELEAIADKPVKRNVIEGEVVIKEQRTKNKKQKASKKKRRKR